MGDDNTRYAKLISQDNTKNMEPTDKPGSVVDNHSSRQLFAQLLKQSTRILRGSRLTNPYLTLLRVEFTSPKLLPILRCALTAPFQPYLCKSHRRYSFCCTCRQCKIHFPGVTWHSTLWSPDFPPLNSI